ncbi:MAG: hypothetical protein QOC62_1790 [Mycobacterium sp.]|jgi:hypothetical protein|nr:hypothetical protein [Mycobacterium sp.]
MNADDRYVADRMADLPFNDLVIVVCTAVFTFTDALAGNDVSPIRARVAKLILKAAMARFGAATVDALLDTLEMPMQTN